ncbi:MAG TPA: AAA family ATPase [Pirellulales bacterium]|nr:AAA family ATPase [Pirellulales bacterium]
MSATKTLDLQDSLLATLLGEDSFIPVEPTSLEDTGLSAPNLEGLVCKYLLASGTCSGRGIAEYICLPFGILEPLLNTLRQRQVIVYAGSAPFNDYYYTLTEHGRTVADGFAQSCAYIGPAPVPLMDYIISVEAQSIAAEAPRREQLEAAMTDISVIDSLYDQLGPAINAGAGMFIYGEPGNGKTTIARRLIECFGQSIWVPHALLEDGQYIKFFDAAYHKPVDSGKAQLLKTQEYDRRWVKVRRPIVVVGGELTMDNLEFRHDPRANISEAPLQMKSNCGCMLIDDFGRQRIDPNELLNRWIVPLENRHDFLTLPTGKKIQVPFEQMILFSTNLEPADLVDEAFLRRLPYKIEVGDPDEQEFESIFQGCAEKIGCEYRQEAFQYLLETHYRAADRPMRRCHPRDLLSQIRNYCGYHQLPLEMKPEYFDRAVKTYFTDALKKGN